jgi:hypothetical protein
VASNFASFIPEVSQKDAIDVNLMMSGEHLLSLALELWPEKHPLS